MAALSRGRMIFELLEDRRLLAIDVSSHEVCADITSDVQTFDSPAVAVDTYQISHIQLNTDILPEQEVAAITFPRGRATLNTAHTTFVADNGNLLRGPFASTEWGNPPPLSAIQSIKNFGANAIHLYGEVFNPDYTGVPGPGDEPGYAVNRIDQMVQMTRDEGLYLVLTIGNGGNNGSFNYDYVMDFWEFYGPRYKNETHVLYEIQNEPHAWSAPYPQAALDMEADAYTLIRSLAPDTPILLFSFAVLGSGPNAVADISEVSASASIDWSNAGVSIHGYAGHEATATSVEHILNAGYPVFMTEFAASDWGTDQDGLDVELTAELERLEVSWLTFQHIPPNFIGAAYTDPAAVYDRVNDAGLSWTPDFGTWPVKRGVYGNDGVPRSTTGLAGTRRIEAEHFDTGGQGIAFYDTDGVNQGAQLRLEDGVDIGLTSDAGGGHDIVWTDDGEWLEYTIFVTEPGFHNLRLRVASDVAGVVRAVFNGEDRTGDWPLPATGGSQTWTTVIKQVFLEYGQQKLRLEIDTGGFSLNWIELSPAVVGQIPNGTYKLLNRKSALAAEADAANNRVIQSEYTGANNERWNFTHRGAGQYSITSVANGHSWNTFYDNNEEPLTLAAWGYDGHPDRRFIVVPADDGFFKVVVVDGGLSIEIDGASLTSGTPAQQYEYAGASHQQWAVLAPAAPSFPTGLNAVWGDPSEVPGDYNSDGAVNGREFLVWQRQFGTNSVDADGDGSGVVDTGDLKLWAQGYGHQAGDAWVQMTWSAVAGATSYNVQRAMTQDGPWETVATSVTTSAYHDTGLEVGGTYYYVVTAVSPGGESLNSAEASPPLLHAHLKFDQSSGTSATDATGNGWNGMLVNGPLWAAGVSGNAADLDGTNDYISFSTGVVNGLRAITIATWVRLDSITNWARLFDFGTGTNTNMFLAPRSGSTSRPVFAITTSGAGGEQRINSSSVTLSANAWTHVAVTIGEGTGIMYINGVEVGRNNSMSLTPASLGATTQNYIGRSQYSSDPYLNGRIDDFRIYDKALSAAEVAELATVRLTAMAALTVAEDSTPATDISSERDASFATLALALPYSRASIKRDLLVVRDNEWWESGDCLARTPAATERREEADRYATTQNDTPRWQRRNPDAEPQAQAIDRAINGLECDFQPQRRDV